MYTINGERLYDTHETAALLGITPASLRTMRADERAPVGNEATRVLFGRVFYDAEAVEKAVALRQRVAQ